MNKIQKKYFLSGAFLVFLFVFIGQAYAASEAPVNSNKNKVDKSACENSGGDYREFEEGGKTITVCVHEDESTTECNGQACMECEGGRRNCGPVEILLPGSNFSTPLRQQESSAVLKDAQPDKRTRPIVIPPNKPPTRPLVAPARKSSQPATGITGPATIMKRRPAAATRASAPETNTVNGFKDCGKVVAGYWTCYKDGKEYYCTGKGTGCVIKRVGTKSPIMGAQKPGTVYAPTTSTKPIEKSPQGGYTPTGSQEMWNRMRK